LNPKLRPLDFHWVKERGQNFLLLRDPLALTDNNVLVPSPLVPLLVLCDGTRDLPALRSALALRGLDLPLAQVQQTIESLDAALALESPRFQQAYDQALKAYREAAFRAPALAGKAYPASAQELATLMAGWCKGDPQGASADSIAGIISPHIDYERGAPVYAKVWQAASRAVKAADLAIVFGTDHAGGPGKITLTRQDYATPFGVIPTDRDIVDSLASALGKEAVFEEEVHHRHEHSVELASVWLHYVREGKPLELIPILCGSFHHFVTGEQSPEGDQAIASLMDTLSKATEGRRVIVIAAADLAHVGPAFGDEHPFDQAGKQSIKAADKVSLEAICQGDYATFFDLIKRESDSRKVCGISPIYLTLRLLGQSKGKVVSYDQCPADGDGGSIVSIAGVLLRKSS